jgi:transposase
MAYPVCLRRFIVDAYLREEGSLAELAEEYGISIPTLHGWVRRARETGDVRSRCIPGRPSKLDAEAQQILHELLAQDNDATLPMLARTLEARTGVTVSPRTVGRVLARLNMTRKKSRSTRPNVAALVSQGCGAGSLRGSRASIPHGSFSSTNSASTSR